MGCLDRTNKTQQKSKEQTKLHENKTKSTKMRTRWVWCYVYIYPSSKAERSYFSLAWAIYRERHKTYTKPTKQTKTSRLHATYKELHKGKPGTPVLGTEFQRRSGWSRMHFWLLAPPRFPLIQPLKNKNMGKKFQAGDPCLIIKDISSCDSFSTPGKDPQFSTFIPNKSLTLPTSSC